MNWLDVALVLAAAVAAYGGWRLGFVRRLSGWLGAAVGLTVAILVAPSLVPRIGVDTDLAVLATVTALLVLLASLGQAIGSVIGRRLRQGVHSPLVGGLDAFAGTLLGILAVAVLAWLVLPVMARVDGWVAEAVGGSSLAELMATRLPAPPRQIQQLEEQFVDGSYPQLFADLRGTPELPAAPIDSPVTSETLDAAAPSAVRLQSETCNRIQSGSGFSVGPGLVATNAHVVAGAEGVDLVSADGTRSTGGVVAFDPAVDLALVRTDMDLPPLRLVAPEEGDRGLVLGFPGGGPFEPSPFEVGELIRAKGYDIYDSATVERDLLALATQLEPGDSGSAVLRADGSVIGVAVAVDTDQSDVAYALSAAELQDLLTGPSTDAVDTGRCIT